METVCLSDNDWAVLLPGEIVTLGETTLHLKPLGLKSLAALLREFTRISSKVGECGITIDNYDSKIIELAGILSTEAPQILSLLTGLAVGDVKRLPLGISVKLLSACFRINIDSQDELVKNLETLTSQITQITQMVDNKG